MQAKYSFLFIIGDKYMEIIINLHPLSYLLFSHNLLALW